MSESTVVVSNDGAFCSGTYRNVCIGIWREAVTLETVKRFRESAITLGTSHPEGTGLVTVFEDGSPPPDQAVRTAMSKALSDLETTLKVSAFIHEATGFSAAAIRGVAAGIALVSRRTYPYKIFGKVDEACGWMAPLLPTGIQGRTSHTSLWSAITSLRQTSLPKKK